MKQVVYGILMMVGTLSAESYPMKVADKKPQEQPIMLSQKAMMAMVHDFQKQIAFGQSRQKDQGQQTQNKDNQKLN